MIFKNIFHTAGTRILNAFFNLVILVMLTNIAGSKGLGIISLIVLDITVIQLLMGLLAGGSLIYFASRYATGALLVVSYGWIILVTVFFALFSWLFHALFPAVFLAVVPSGFAFDILFLGMLNGFMQIHYNLLIGQKRITSYNFIFTLQITAFLLFFSWQLLVFKENGPRAYILSMYLAWGLGSLMSLYQIAKQNNNFTPKGWLPVTKKLLQYGFPTQSAVMLHLGNKRLSFYFIRIFAGLTPLGIYSAGVQLTEGLRLIGQSISLVQYSAISNSRDGEYARILSIRLMKFTLLLTLLALLVLLIIPESFYNLAFSHDFTVIKSIVLVLSPGVLALAANTIFSHYFSGTGQPAVNLRANITGFFFTLLFAFLLIPPYGYMGAAATASINYLASMFYQYIIFRRQTHTRWQEWVIDKKDLSVFMATLSSIRHTTKPSQ